jgi:hypothetical protein
VHADYQPLDGDQTAPGGLSPSGGLSQPLTINFLGIPLHVFVDESGSFTGYHGRSLSVVGALAIPDGKLEFLKQKYAKMRSCLPLENGEVKGRLLNEHQVQIAKLLARNDVIFEITAIDFSFHTEADISAYKQQHAKGMLARVDDFQEPDRTLVEQACH